MRCAERLLRADPLDETVLRRAMRSGSAAGDLRGAVLAYEAFRDRLADELGIEPEAATEALLQGLPALVPAAPIARSSGVTAVAAGARGVHLLALAPSVHRRHRLVGREAALADLTARLHDDGVRLLTLLGPGGMGKTTLAGALADDLTPAFPQGVVVARLDTASGPDAVARTLALAAGITLDVGVPLDVQLVDAFGERRMLLVLDSFEPHLAEPASLATVDALVRGSPSVALLVTTRARLRHSSEVVFDVGPLTTRSEPGNGALEAAREPSDAARLFLQVADVRARGDDDPLDLELVERICRQLGGAPLAIELVAAWTDVVPLAVLEERLERSWELLRSEDADRQPRQHDVQAILAETWAALAPADQAAWARLSVLPGSVGRVVAAAVGGTGWRGLRRLADRAVLRRSGDRIEIHALVARFGRERAREKDLVNAAWRAARPVLLTHVAQEVDPRTGTRVRVHDDDLEGAIGVWRHAVAHAEWPVLTDSVYGLMRALGRARRLAERDALADEAVTALLAARGRSRDAALARVLPFAPGDRPKRRAHARRAWALARRFGDDRALAAAVVRLLEIEPGVHVGERVACAVEAFERAGDTIGLAALRADLGEDAALLGRHAEAAVHLEAALALYTALGDRSGRAQVHDTLTTTPLVRGDFASVRYHLDRARALYAEEGAVVAEAITYATETWLAIVTATRADAEAAAATFARRAAPFRGGGLAQRVLGLGIAHRHGTSDEVIAAAPALLAQVGAPERASIVGLLGLVLLAIAHARRGDVEAAAAALDPAVRMARELDGPRFVAHAVLAAAELARGREERAAALAFAAQAWHHPALEYEQREDVRALTEALGGEWPPPRPDPADDATLLDRVGALLRGA